MVNPGIWNLESQGIWHLGSEIWMATPGLEPLLCDTRCSIPRFQIPDALRFQIPDSRFHVTIRVRPDHVH
jgi:hypothetical protein